MFTEEILRPQVQKRVTRWIAALRSGKYKQTRNTLHRKSGGYCCLGVACAISRLGKWEVGSILSDDLLYYTTNGRMSRTDLPRPVMEYFGLIDPAGSYNYNKAGEATAALASKNDSGVSFKMIANIIENQMNKAIQRYQKNG